MGELTCRDGTRLVTGATPFDPQDKIAPFCMDATEISQGEDHRLYLTASHMDYERVLFKLIYAECTSFTLITEGYGSLASLKKRAATLTDKCGSIITRADPSDFYPVEERYRGPKKPLTERNFEEARGICQARGMDLPTAEQWEKAARGPLGYQYGTKSGELKESEAAYRLDGPADVMSFPPNGYGLYDMTGNVAEWTLDNTQGFHNAHNVRGGWWTGNGFLRADHNYSGLSDAQRHPWLGFRCVAEPQVSAEKPWWSFLARSAYSIFTM